jgi:transporter family protein
MSAICFGLAHNLRKIGFEGMDSLLFGGFLQGASAAAVAPIILKIASRGQAYAFNPRSVRYFLLSGLAMSTAMLTLLYALRGGQVSLVGPILAAAPLFALVLTYLLLGSQEKITSRILGGACLIVSGVVLVASLK